MQTNRKESIGLIAILSFITLLVGGVYWNQMKRAAQPTITVREAGSVVPPASAAPSPPATAPTTTGANPLPALPAPSAEIVIHVTGAVKKPGVYHLAPGSRGDDAIKAAGGAANDANLDALNLAAHLEDGSQIHVPTHKEQPAADPQAAQNFIKHDTVATKTEASKSATHSAVHAGGHSGHGSNKLKPGSSTTININTADSDTLQKLPGIGPAMAERILEYRKENGGFKSPEELMQVSGIGPKKFEKMSAFVKVK